MNLVIDHREPDEFKIAVSGALASLGLPACGFDNLPCADAAIRDATDGSTRALFERKTWTDLAASVKDGRWAEQRQLLVAAGTCRGTRAVVVIVERDAGRRRGSIFDLDASSTSMINGMPLSTLTSCALNAMLRDGLGVLTTDGVAETANAVVACFARMHRHPDKYKEPTGPAGGEEDALQRAARMRAIGPRQCYEQQLCQVPGVSTQTARAIADVYPNWPSLVDAMRGAGDHARRVDLMVDTVTVSKRRLSTRVARSLSSTLFFVDDEEAKPISTTSHRRAKPKKALDDCERVRIDTDALFPEGTDANEDDVVGCDAAVLPQPQQRPVDD